MIFIAGFILFLSGWLAVLSGGQAFGQFVYPLLWWGFLLILDEINFWRWRESPIKSRIGKFLGIILPFSALYWLYFEFANFAFPQWRYIVGLENASAQTLLTFISFATVIPIIIEIFWLMSGPIKSAAAPTLKLPLTAALVLTGAFFAALPFISNSFWLNQLIWIAPFFILLPWLDASLFKRHALVLAAAGIVSGFLWELFNFWAGAKWEYLILPQAARLFEMPLLGYLGFIPFAFSTIAVYLAATKLKSKPWPVILYPLALLMAYLFVSNF